jgi:tetratricopeptide (TPR) repeat protein
MIRLLLIPCRTVCAVIFAITLTFVFTAANAGDFHAANQLYDQGKFTEAKQHYEQLAEAQPPSANVFYNLGNTNHRLGAPGPAMLAYERALALDPTHPEARANLALLHRQNGSRLWPESWLDRAFPGRNADVYVAVATIAAWLAIFCFALIFVRSCGEKFGLWLGGIAGLIVAAYAGTAVWHLGKNRALAIVVAKEAEARLAPAESAGPAGTLPAGSQVRVLSERGDWIYCELPGSGRGWFPATSLERVRPERSSPPEKILAFRYGEKSGSESL